MEDNYIVVEMQTAPDGTTSLLTDVFDDLPQAYQKFYTVLSYAAVSELPMHSAVILTNRGYTVSNQLFERPELYEKGAPDEDDA